MTAQDDARALIERTAAPHGLPHCIADPATIGRLAALFTKRNASRPKLALLEVGRDGDPLHPAA